eukprot:TRINITY_DN974_c0_g1_i19.p1 TRINITY_DN974_c0_g1~~TRINITY_DN974_c0_g1_i19.p1  ORF type:complete len:282 (+),score=-12.72 TRINITY_DN974_c0_g1_i19:30-848(+)
MDSRDIKSRNFSEICEPIIKIGNFGLTSKEFYRPRGICIDPSSELLYVIDTLSGNVHVCSLNGDYIQQFGDDCLHNADSITIMGRFAYITNYNPSRIFKFRLMDYLLISHTEDVIHPFGISSIDDEIFVCETDSNRISVFDTMLSKKRQLDKVRLSWCWSIEVLRDILYALEVFQNCIVRIDKDSGALLDRVIINKDGLSLSHAYYFCMDHNSNFFITDYSNHIKILNSSGELLKTIRTEIFDSFLPRGIAVDKNNLIVVVFRSGAYSLLIF